MIPLGNNQSAPASYNPKPADSADAVESLRLALQILERERTMRAENITHACVPGYKRRLQRLTSTVHEATGLRLPMAAGTKVVMAQGVLELTGNQLDFAIEGNGHFEVKRPNGSLFYKRGGRFRQDFNGRLVTADGYLLTDQVAVPPDAQGISVSADGQRSSGRRRGTCRPRSAPFARATSNVPM